MTIIKSFTDLNAWKESHSLVLLVYKITANFPDKERFGLTDQARRSAVSIGSNIAEGFSRQGRKEKMQFYFMAKGSLTELQNLILVARDVGYLSMVDFDKTAKQTVIVGKLLTGLIKSVRSR